LEATQLIIEAMPDAKIVMLTIHDEDDKLFEAIRSGAVGYLLKDTTSELLIPMLRGVMRGEAAISGEMATRILAEFRRQHKPTTSPHTQNRKKNDLTLTARERQVLEHVVAGAMDKEIAVELSISINTVKTHMRNILAKLHATSRHQAAAYAIKDALVRSPN